MIDIPRYDFNYALQRFSMFAAKVVRDSLFFQQKSFSGISKNMDGLELGAFYETIQAVARCRQSSTVFSLRAARKFSPGVAQSCKNQFSSSRHSFYSAR